MSPGFWALTPFSLAPEEKVRAQAEMKSLGRPGVGEQILAQAGFVDVRRHAVPFAWEFPDPETFARMLASTGPAYEAIQEVGEEEFYRRCVQTATERLREGVPLRAEIDCVGFTARVPQRRAGILMGTAADTEDTQAMAKEDLEMLGFVSNVTKLWMHDPVSRDVIFDAVRASAKGAGLSIAERGVATVVAATAAGDSYCPLAWGSKLGTATSPELAASVLLGSDELLDERSRAIAAWARKAVAAHEQATTEDIDRLRTVGFTDPEIVRLTTFIALRVAFSLINGALGARPEQEYVDHVDVQVRAAWERALLAR